jgi:hypothetical protein
MSFGTPWMLLLLVPVAAVAWLMTRARRLQYEAACRLHGVTPANRPGLLSRRDSLALAALACMVVALARPQWNPRSYDVQRRGRDVVFVVDVSRSMLAADLFPSRLERARIAIHEALPALAGQRVGLVTYAGSASVQVPLTLDHGFVRYMLERADPANVDKGSTSLQAAVEKVADTVLSDASGGQRDIVVLTDGEDHLSDIGKTAERLAECSARVLIVGLGDPVRGARVPDPLDEQQWMMHNGEEVISRLQERTLEALAGQAANVTYHPARVRPFDLVTLYRQWETGASDHMVVGGLSRVRYTEGYPYLLAFSIVLWLASAPIRVPSLGRLLLLALLLSGCTGPTVDNDDEAFRERYRQGSELRRFAKEISVADPFAERSLLTDAREQFLRAALLKQGDIKTARQITAITRRLRELETVIEQQRAERRQQGEQLADMIRRLQELSAGQEQLAQRSQSIMRRRTVRSEEEYNLPDPSLDQLPPQAELERLAPAFSPPQRSLREGTSSVHGGLVKKQQALRQILTRAYGNVDTIPATEIDPIVELLASTVAAQEKALANLAPGAVRWPQVNTALHTAAGRMEQALEALRGLQPPSADEDDDAMASRKIGNIDGEMEELDAEQQDGAARPVSPGDFQEALSLQTLPIPGYTAAEILAEEAANQQKRTRRKAARAGAQVEKNW